MGFGNWTEQGDLAAPPDAVFAALVEVLSQESFDIKEMDAEKRSLVAYHEQPFWRRFFRSGGSYTAFTRIAALIEAAGTSESKYTIEASPTYDFSMGVEQVFRGRARQIVEWLKEHLAVLDATPKPR